LLSNCQNKLEIIVTFLAILDLIRLFKILVYQNELFDDFEIHRLEKN
jgi:chromatin segregation and condensation protein Rec8/ScpA/Scc1 (kleisin family)